MGMTAVYMEAMQASDKWGVVEYYFDETSGNPGGSDSGWQISSTYTDTGLTANVEYRYTVKVRDVAGNETQLSEERSATPGVDNMAPTPNPAEWEIVPYQNGVSTIRMVARVATDAEGNGVSYSFICLEDGTLSSGWIASNEYVTPAVLVPDQTYTFSVRYRDNSVNLNVTEPSVSVAVTIGTVDAEPPTQPTITSAVKFTYLGQNYHVVTSSESTDDSGVEYQFECTTAGGLIATAVHVDWINIDNVVAGIYPFGETLYPNGTLKVANKIWIPVFGVVNHTYRVRARDRSLNMNMTEWSLPVTTQ
jgi:hypothetical protein